jgi:hypothetical protein
LKRFLDKDLVAGLFLIVLGVVYYRAADALPRSLISDRVGASGFPKLLASVLIIFSGVLIIQTIIRKMAQQAEEEEGKTEKTWRDFAQAAGMLGLGAGYLVIVTRVGYMLGIAFLLASALRYQKEPFSARLLLTALFGGVLFWAFFVFALKTPMPSGPWAALLGWR